MPSEGITTMNHTLLPLAATLLSGLSLAPATSAQMMAIQPGEEVSHSFRSPLLGGRGLKSLDDLRGKPVLIEFWGTK